MNPLNRRDALKLTAGFAAAQAVGAIAETAPKFPILDAHIHLFDPTRPGGVVWPEKTDSVLYKPALPGRYEQVTRGMGIVGAIAIEASPLESDNDWVLNQAAANPIMVGMVGNLAPGSESFAHELDRLHSNPLFLGIRYGNLWNRDLLAEHGKPSFVADLRKLAAAGLVFESANPDARLVEALLDISQQVPELRIMIDHLPNAAIPTEAAAQKQFWVHLRELGQNQHVFIKLSEVPVRESAQLQTKTAFYKEKLDALWEIFGEDRVLFGSDWPNSDHIASYAETLGIVRSYVASKGPGALEKYFYKNSVAAYRWNPRKPNQSA